MRISADGRLHFTVALHPPVREGQINAFHGPRLELANQRGLRFQGFRHHQKTAGVLVQPVHNARARNFLQGGRMVQQRIEERPGPVPAARVNHQSGGFVDHENRLIFMHHAKTDIFGGWRGLTRVAGRAQFHQFPSPDFLVRAQLALVQQYPSFLQPGGDTASGVFREHPGQCAVYSHASAIGGDLPAYRGFGHDRGVRGAIII